MKQMSTRTSQNWWRMLSKTFGVIIPPHLRIVMYRQQQHERWSFEEIKRFLSHSIFLSTKLVNMLLLVLVAQWCWHDRKHNNKNTQEGRCKTEHRDWWLPGVNRPLQHTKLLLMIVCGINNNPLTNSRSISCYSSIHNGVSLYILIFRAGSDNEKWMQDHYKIVLKGTMEWLWVLCKFRRV